MAEPTQSAGASGVKKKSIVIALAVVLVVAASGMFARIAFRHKPEPKPNLHHVTLHWKAVKPIPGVTAVTYNVYRGAASGGTHMKIASGITSLTYDDANAESGKTYSYVVTAMDQRGLESRFSSEVRAVIP
jgi:hypothetical protein